MSAQQRRRSLRRVGGIALVACTIALLVPIPLRGELWSATQNAGHTLAFAVLTLIALRLLDARDRLTLATAALACATLLLFGFLAEAGQSLTGRDPSLVDARRNAIGIAIGATVHAGWRASRLPGAVRVLLLAMAVLALLGAFREPIRLAIALSTHPAPPAIEPSDRPLALD